MTKDGHDGYIFYTEETSFGVVADDQIWDRMLEVTSVSGRGPSQEVKDMRRHGKRGRAGHPRGKRDEDPLVFECTMVDDAVATNQYDVFIQGIFTEAFDVAPTSYVFIISDNTNPSASTNLEYYYGCTLDEIEITIEEGEPIGLSMSFIRSHFLSSASELHVSSSNTYNAYPATIVYLLWSDVTISKVAATGWTNTGVLPNVSSMTITVSQGGEKKFRINGSKMPKDVHFGEFMISGSMTIDYDNLDEITEVESEKEGDLEVVISPTAGLVATITLTGSVYEGFPFDSEVNSLITADVDYSSDAVTFA
ncbi:hypothetical protein LCGC14_0821700 [marine sediment metagenome]|uniref:Uncharacterized protein n=1 Tax=marine sediment metagenome TaxID=412755 RepID=A0A0F9Q3V6_9ZZZZ